MRSSFNAKHHRLFFSFDFTRKRWKKRSFSKSKLELRALWEIIMEKERSQICWIIWESIYVFVSEEWPARSSVDWAELTNETITCKLNYIKLIFNFLKSTDRCNRKYNLFCESNTKHELKESFSSAMKIWLWNVGTKERLLKFSHLDLALAHLRLDIRQTQETLRLWELLINYYYTYTHFGKLIELNLLIVNLLNISLLRHQLVVHDYNHTQAVAAERGKLL